MRNIDIAIIEDKKEYREVLKVIINGTKGFDCHSDYSNGTAALSGIRNNQPDIVLVDLGLPDISGIECIRILKNEFPIIQFMVVSISDDDELVFEALTAGAGGYITKGTNHSEIIECIKELSNGGAPMSPSIAKKVLRFFNISTRDLAEAYKNDLGKREIEVLELLIQGLSYSTIANKMYISKETVKTHCHNIYKKLHVKSKDGLISKIYSKDPMIFKLKEKIRALNQQIQELQNLLSQK